MTNKSCRNYGLIQCKINVPVSFEVGTGTMHKTFIDFGLHIFREGPFVIFFDLTNLSRKYSQNYLIRGVHITLAKRGKGGPRSANKC